MSLFSVIGDASVDIFAMDAQCGEEEVACFTPPLSGRLKLAQGRVLKAGQMSRRPVTPLSSRQTTFTGSLRIPIAAAHKRPQASMVLMHQVHFISHKPAR